MKDGQPDYLSFSKQEKMRFTENIVIESPQFKVIMDKISECHQRSKYTTEPRCLFITGGTGYGKTTIGKHYSKSYPKAVNDEGTTIPVLRSSLPSPASIKSMASWLLKDLGDPLPDKGTTSQITMRLCGLIGKCGVELIILDEFQHMIDRDTENVLTSSADWLKQVLNETGVPMVLMGMPWAARILEGNDQLKRRFAAKIDLKPFGWSSLKEQKEFVRFLIVLEKALPILKPSNLYSGDMSFSLFCASRGVISNIKKLVSKAAEKAFEMGMESITMELLSLAYDEELALDNPKSVNPFKVDTATLVVPEPPRDVDPRAHKRQRGSRKAAENISSMMRK